MGQHVLPSGILSRQPSPEARIKVGGVDFDVLDESGAVDRIITAFGNGIGGRAVFVNVDVLVKLERQPGLVGLVEPADLVLADGMPLIWASRVQGTPLPGRVAGSTLLGLVVARSALEGVPVLVVGGRPGSAEAAVAALKQANPGLRAGWYTPPFGFEADPESRIALKEALDSFGPCLCFVGLGFPKQERLMAELAGRCPDWWFIASGGGIDFLARNDRAPGWMQRVGLEWAHRLSREPKRLAKRYLVDDVPYACRMLVAAWRRRR